MFILADIEWIADEQEQPQPTQLAAVRTDADWNTADTFFALIRPEGEQDWEHMAFNGHAPEEFRRAQPLCEVLRDFAAWVQPEDILCWWHYQSEQLLPHLAEQVQITLRNTEELSLKEYVLGFLGRSGSVIGLCRELGIELPSPAHCAENDAEALRRLVQAIGLPQEMLCDENGRKKPLTAIRGTTRHRLLYDEKAKRLHRADCVLLPKHMLCPVYETFKSPIRKRLIPCACCRAEYLAALKERNRNSIERCRWQYVYAAGSAVYHRKDCPYVLAAYSIGGFGKPSTVKKYGLRPCRFCCPDRKKPKPVPEKPKLVSKRGLCRAEREAIDRVRRAQAERAAEKQERTAAEQRKTKLLTQPGFAFWAGKGYRTFHLRDCPRLEKPQQLRGFRRYQDAVNAGYKPCRQCRPTAKQDALYSIPITSHERSGESADTLVQLCTERGIPFEQDERYFVLRTAVGIWRIDLHALPVHLAHINLVKQREKSPEYHIQPRLFLSLRDAFRYILRHDKTLKKQAERGIRQT